MHVEARHVESGENGFRTSTSCSSIWGVSFSGIKEKFFG